MSPQKATYEELWKPETTPESSLGSGPLVDSEISELWPEGKVSDELKAQRSKQRDEENFQRIHTSYNRQLQDERIFRMSMTDSEMKAHDAMIEKAKKGEATEAELREHEDWVIQRRVKSKDYRELIQQREQKSLDKARQKTKSLTIGSRLSAAVDKGDLKKIDTIKSEVLFSKMIELDPELGRLLVVKEHNPEVQRRLNQAAYEAAETARFVDDNPVRKKLFETLSKTLEAKATGDKGVWDARMKELPLEYELEELKGMLVENSQDYGWVEEALKEAPAAAFDLAMAPMGVYDRAKEFFGGVWLHDVSGIFNFKTRRAVQKTAQEIEKSARKAVLVDQRYQKGSRIAAGKPMGEGTIVGGAAVSALSAAFVPGAFHLMAGEAGNSMFDRVKIWAEDNGYDSKESLELGALGFALSALNTYATEKISNVAMSKAWGKVLSKSEAGKGVLLGFRKARVLWNEGNKHLAVRMIKGLGTRIGIGSLEVVEEFAEGAGDYGIEKWLTGEGEWTPLDDIKAGAYGAAVFSIIGAGGRIGAQARRYVKETKGLKQVAGSLSKAFDMTEEQAQKLLREERKLAKKNENLPLSQKTSKEDRFVVAVNNVLGTSVPLPRHFDPSTTVSRIEGQMHEALEVMTDADAKRLRSEYTALAKEARRTDDVEGLRHLQKLRGKIISETEFQTAVKVPMRMQAATMIGSGDVGSIEAAYDKMYAEIQKSDMTFEEEAQKRGQTPEGSLKQMSEEQRERYDTEVFDEKRFPQLREMYDEVTKLFTMKREKWTSFVDKITQVLGLTAGDVKALAKQWGTEENKGQLVLDAANYAMLEAAKYHKNWTEGTEFRGKTASYGFRREGKLEYLTREEAEAQGRSLEEVDWALRNRFRSLMKTALRHHELPGVQARVVKGEKVRVKQVEAEVLHGVVQELSELEKAGQQLEVNEILLKAELTKTELLYMTDMLAGEKAAEIARSRGRTEGTVSLTLGKARKKIQAVGEFQALRSVGEDEITKGQVRFLDDGRAVIRILQTADASTGLHELAHVWRRHLSKGLLEQTEKALGVKDGVWTVKNEEAFAKQFEAFAFISGRSRRVGELTPELLPAFRLFKTWMTQIYGVTKETPLGIKISSGMHSIFRAMFIPPQDFLETGERLKDPAYRNRVTAFMHDKLGVLLDLVDPIMFLKGKYGEDLGAAMINATHFQERVSHDFGIEPIKATAENVMGKVDSTINDSEAWFQRQPKKVQEAFHLAKAIPQTARISVKERNVILTLQVPAHRLLNERFGEKETGVLLQFLQDTSDKIFLQVEHRARGNIAYVQNYWRGKYKPLTEKASIRAKTRYGDMGTSFEKSKKFVHFGQAKVRGLELQKLNPVTNLRQEISDLGRVLGLTGLRTYMLSEDAGRGFLIKKSTHEGLGWVKVGKQEPSQPFYGWLVKADAAKVLNNLLDANQLGTTKLGKLVKGMNQLSMNVAFLGTFFHGITILKQMALDSGILGMGEFKKLTTEAKRLGTWKAIGRSKMKLTKEEYKRPLFGRYLQSGGGKSFSHVVQSQQMLEGIITRVTGALGPLGKAFDKVRIVRFLFNEFIPLVKYRRFEAFYEKELRAAQRKDPSVKSLSDAKVQDLIREGQNFYGEINERLYGRKAWQIQAERLVFLAPGWFEGNLRTILRAATMWPGATKEKLLSRSRLNIINAVGVSYLMAQFGKAFSPFDEPDKKFPTTMDEFTELFKVVIKPETKELGAVALDMRHMLRDYSHVLFEPIATGIRNGIWDGMKESFGGLLTRARHMKAPFQTLLFDVLSLTTGQPVRDWTGEEVSLAKDTPWESLYKHGRHWLDAHLTPISVSAARRSLKYKKLSAPAAWSLAVLGMRVDWTEEELRFKKLVQTTYDLRDQKDRLYKELWKQETTFEDIDRVNKLIEDFRNDSYLVKMKNQEKKASILKMLKPIDKDDLVLRRIYALTQWTSTTKTAKELVKQGDQAFSFMDFHDVSFSKAKQVLYEDYKERWKKSKSKKSTTKAYKERLRRLNWSWGERAQGD